jgi:hypothetical protein
MRRFYSVSIIGLVEDYNETVGTHRFLSNVAGARAVGAVSRRGEDAQETIFLLKTSRAKSTISIAGRPL